MTFHKIIIGNCINMTDIADKSIQLVVTSPPYFNAPYDYKNYFISYNEYLNMMEQTAKELYRVLQNGRIVALNIDDMLVNGEKFPIVADVTKIFINTGFKYRDRIIWKKPDGYVRISRRSGVLIQHPYPMYYYPDNITESILIFQKGVFDYYSISNEVKELSKIDIEEFNEKKIYMSLWEMINVLPNSKLEKNVAAFPEELPYRLIKLFSYTGETVLDPFVGSGTTMKVARDLNRNSIGIEIKKSLLPIIQKKIGNKGQLSIENQEDILDVIIKNDCI